MLRHLDGRHMNLLRRSTGARSRRDQRRRGRATKLDLHVAQVQHPARHFGGVDEGAGICELSCWAGILPGNCAPNWLCMLLCRQQFFLSASQDMFVLFSPHHWCIVTKIIHHLNAM